MNTSRFLEDIIPAARRRRPALVASALSVILAVGLSAASAQEEASVADTTADVFSDVLSTLGQHGLKVDADAARRAAAEAVMRTADPLARLVEESDIQQLKRDQLGLVFAPGIQLTMTNGTPKVTALVGDSPAEAAGVTPGDRIIRIDGEELGYTDIATVSTLLRGTDEAKMTLVTLGPLQQTNRVEVGRKLLRIPAIETAEEIPSDLCYIRVNGLNKGSATEIVSILRSWEDADRFGVVLDLRGADGGDVKAAAELAGLFAEPGALLFSFRDGSEQDLSVHRAESGKPLGMPTMVLIDEKTSGSAEVLAASLKRSVRGAMLLGAPSAGDPVIREVVRISPAYQAYLATRRLVTADGTVYSGSNRVEPDILVEPDTQPFVEVEPPTMTRKRETLDEELEDLQLRNRVKGDSALHRAVDILLGLKALDIRTIHYSQSDPG